MKFFDKLGKVLTNNLAYTIILVIALVLFLYFAEGDLIAGILTALSALVVYVCVTLLYGEYEKTPAPKKAVAEKPAKKVAVKKAKAPVKTTAKKPVAKKATKSKKK